MNLSNSRKFIAAAALMVSAVSAATAQRIFADVTGKWTVSNDSPNGPVQSVATLKQDSTVLTGTIDVPQFGTAKVTGTVKGDSVRYSFPLDIQGNVIEVHVSGVLKDRDNMAGMITLPQDMGSYPFTAKRMP